MGSKAVTFKDFEGNKVYPCPYYPVGSIYISVNNINPTTYFGGVWEQIKDKFLLACGSTYGAGATGGEATHKLTESEMPKHQHKHNPNDSTAVGVSFKNGTANRSYRIGSNSSGQYVFSALATDSLEFATTSTAKTGGDNAHNNMPPYLAVYVWKRTA